MIFKLCSILLASASLLGSAVGAPVEASDGMIHEYITRADGTVDHFAYHSSFIGDSDLDGNLTTVGVINNPSNALKQRNIFGLDAAVPGSNQTTVGGPVEWLDKPFIGSTSYQNASFCGFPAPIPDWNSIGFLNRPDTYDCVRLLEMWLHKPGYFQLSKFGGVSETDWSFLTLYNTCEMDVRRLDFENQWGARVGSFDIMVWVTAAMLVSVGKEYENPEVFKYMASISGSIGCEEMGPNPIALCEFELIRNAKYPKPTGTQATQTPTLTPLPASMSPYLTRPTPSSFPGAAMSTVSVTPTTTLPDTTITETVAPTSSAKNLAKATSAA